MLGAALADGNWHESASVKQLMTAAGYSERTTQRAAKVLRVEVDRRGIGAEHTAWWRRKLLSLAGVLGCSTSSLTQDQVLSRNLARVETFLNHAILRAIRRHSRHSRQVAPMTETATAISAWSASSARRSPARCVAMPAGTRHARERARRRPHACRA